METQVDPAWFERVRRINNLCTDEKLHLWRHVRTIGHCVTLLRCDKCGAEWRCDSSD